MTLAECIVLVSHRLVTNNSGNTTNKKAEQNSTLEDVQNFIHTGHTYGNFTPQVKKEVQSMRKSILHDGCHALT